MDTFPFCKLGKLIDDLLQHEYAHKVCSKVAFSH